MIIKLMPWCCLGVKLTPESGVDGAVPSSNPRYPEGVEVPRKALKILTEVLGDLWVHLSSYT